jgi:hypothetical protein
MSRVPIVVPPSRPTLVDYVFLMVGSTLSLILFLISPSPVHLTRDNGTTFVQEFFVFLPGVMRLPEGILLMGPVFYVTQLIRRRSWALTSVEWLWLLDALGIALLAGVAVWERSGTLPDFLHPYAPLPRQLWYLVFVPSMAALAAVLAIFGFLRRGVTPWTHTFGLVLLLWPIAPLVGILSLGKFV